MKISVRNIGALSVYSLIIVARPAAALSGAPNHSAGGPQDRLAAPRKKVQSYILARVCKRTLCNLMLQEPPRKSA